MSDSPDETVSPRDDELSPFTLRRRRRTFRRTSRRGRRGERAEHSWFLRFERAKEQGLAALEALRHWRGEPEHPHAGRIAASAIEQEAPSLDALHRVSR